MMGNQIDEWLESLQRREKHAAYCATRNIYADMEAAAKSLIANSDVDRVHFLIEDAEFPSELPGIIEVHDVSGQAYFPPDGANADAPCTWMVLMRMALCHILTDVDMVLSLDCDTFCTDDVSDVWETDLDGAYFAAAKDWHKSGDGLLYCNFGVVLFDLGMLRDGKADECIDVLNRRKYACAEQDVGNYLCQGRIAELQPTYNSNWWTDRKRTQNPRIVHYAGEGRARWMGEHFPRLYADMPWERAMELHDGMVR